MKKTSDIILNVREKVKNDELRDYILENLNNFICTKGFKFIGNKKNELNIKLINSDKFMLGMYPSIDNFDTIIIERSYWNEKIIEKKIIHFDSNIINVEELSLEKIVYSDTNKLSEISQKRQIKKYQDDILIYQYKYESTICNKIDSERNHTIESEMYIDGEYAVKKEITIKQNDAFGLDSGISYSATNGFMTPYFDSSKDTTKVYIYGMHVIAPNEYVEFVKKYQDKQKQLTKV